MATQRFYAGIAVGRRAVTEIAVLGVQGQVLGQRPADTGQKVVANCAVFVTDHNRHGGGNSGARAGSDGGEVGANDAETGTDIRTVPGGTAELVNGRGHYRPGVNRAVALFKRAERAGLVETVSELTFNPPVVAELITDRERFAKIAFAIDFAGRVGGERRAGDIGIARGTVTESAADVPAFLGGRYGRQSKKSTDSSSCKKPFFS